MNTYRIEYAYSNIISGYISAAMYRDVKADNIDEAIAYLKSSLACLIHDLDILVVVILDIEKIESEEQEND